MFLLKNHEFWVATLLCCDTVVLWHCCVVSVVLWHCCVVTLLCCDTVVLWHCCVVTVLCCECCVVTLLCCDTVVLWRCYVVTVLCCDSVVPNVRYTASASCFINCKGYITKCQYAITPPIYSVGSVKVIMWQIINTGLLLQYFASMHLAIVQSLKVSSSHKSACELNFNLLL